MSEDSPKVARQGRSPAYPFISLRKALERAEQFRKAEGRHAVPPDSAYRAWELSKKGNSARQTTAALRYYGLMEYEGRGGARQVRLTDRARKILLDKQPESPERDELIREAALTPAVFSDMWREWGVELPSDATIETFLMRDQGFSESATPDVITSYKDTLSFAKLDQPDIMSPDEGEEEGAELVHIPEVITDHGALPHMSTHVPTKPHSAERQSGQRTICRYDFEPEGTVILLATGPVSTEDALDTIEALIKMKREELKRRTEKVPESVAVNVVPSHTGEQER